MRIRVIISAHSIIQLQVHVCRWLAVRSTVVPQGRYATLPAGYVNAMAQRLLAGQVQIVRVVPVIRQSVLIIHHVELIVWDPGERVPMEHRRIQSQRQHPVVVRRARRPMVKRKHAGQIV